MKKKIVFICSVLVITLEVFLYNFVFKYKITLIGNETIKIPLNSVYNDAGVVVRHLGKKTDKYNIISNLNTKITGKYEILYDSGTETKNTTAGAGSVSINIPVQNMVALMTDQKHKHY